MKLHLFRHLWGIERSWDVAFPLIKSVNYVGIEAGLPNSTDITHFSELLAAHNFEYIAQIFTAGKTVDEHLVSFRQQLSGAAVLNPVLVNCHSGKDSWTVEDSRRFFDGALQMEADQSLPVAHETHRGRILYNPWITAQLLDTFEQLHLCADFSHWVCVCERLLTNADELKIIRQCAERCIHIHARVGYEEGPQVPDPRAPEYQTHLAAHESWWDLIWAAQAAQNQPVSTLTPEFGPPAYAHTLPFTQMPVSDVSAICDWQAERQAQRFARLIDPSG